MKRLLAAFALSIALAVGLAPGLALAADNGGLTIGAATLITQEATGYDIWVGGVEVTSANASNVKGEGITGKVSYDAASNTLTLDNAAITGSHSESTDNTFLNRYAIYQTGSSSLTIKLTGSNEVKISDSQAFVNGIEGVYGIYGPKLIFTGGGALSVTSEATHTQKGVARGSQGITSAGAMTIDAKTTVNVTSSLTNAPQSSGKCYGVQADSLTVKGTLSAIARSKKDKADALYITWKGGATVAAGGKLVATVEGGNESSSAIYIQETSEALTVNGCVKAQAVAGDSNNEHSHGVSASNVAVGEVGELEACGCGTALSDNASIKLAKGKYEILAGDSSSSAKASTTSGVGSAKYVRIKAVPSLSNAKVTLTKAGAAYTGKTIKPSVKSVVLGGKTLKSGTDYTVSTKSGKNVGSYKVTVTGKGSYEGTASATFKITKAANKLSKTKVTKTCKAKSLKKKAATIALPTAKFGKATWEVAAKDKKKALTLTKAGKVKVKKGAKASTYTIKLKANVKGTKNYKALKNKVVTVKVKMK